MKVRIHRGTKEIGGACVEIESQGKRIVLDIGLPLDVADPETFPLHPVGGFDSPDPNLLGVIISHPHQDHYGLAHRLPKETPFLIGKAAEAILAAADVFTPAGLLLQNVVHLEDRTPITLGPFRITPYLVDHSAYDAYAILVEADGVSLFYTGDLRAHPFSQL
jgi:ribonuclease J